ncbi:MAG TPA: hypothetical protein ENJ77_01430, partial [Candidatus Moranbacteria bacterium]|nr:hypothetical protein [Candidatus Moranbacteria bacterium]
AAPVLILSVLAVGLFYLFLREFFAPGRALGLTALMATSLFFVTYGRFAWNPNLIPFFIIALAFCLLRLSSPRTSSRGKGWFLIGAAASLAVLGQAHFLAFVAAPVIAVGYLLWTRPRIPWRFWLAAAAVFALFQVPLIINDYKTGGENTKAFLAMALGKSGDDSKTWLEKSVRAAGNQVKYYWLVNTGDQRAELPTIRGRDIRCDRSCRDGLPAGAAAGLLLAAGAAAWLILWRRETESRRRNFLRLVLLWYGTVWLLFLPLAYSSPPRFFLLNAPVNIVLSGLVLEVIARGAARRGAFWRRLPTGLLAIFVLSNLFFTLGYFRELSRAGTDKNLRIATDYVLKEKTRVTLGQMEDLLDEIAAVYRQNKEPIFLHAQGEYKRAFWERLDYRGLPRFNAPKDLSKAYRRGNYFLISRTQSDVEKSFAKILRNADILRQKTFGTLTLYQLVPKESVIVPGEPEPVRRSRDPKFSSRAQVRYLWRQIWD